MASTHRIFLAREVSDGRKDCGDLKRLGQGCGGTANRLRVSGIAEASGLGANTSPSRAP